MGVKENAILNYLFFDRQGVVCTLPHRFDAYGLLFIPSVPAAVSHNFQVDLFMFQIKSQEAWNRHMYLQGIRRVLLLDG